MEIGNLGLEVRNKKLRKQNMKLVVNKDELSENPGQFLRRVGYGYIRDRHSGQDSYVRRLTR